MWDGKVILITGASRGIGSELARLMAKKGAHLVVTGRSLDTPSHARLEGTLENLVDEIRADGGLATARRLDVRDTQAARNVVADIKKDLGRLDVLVNNASAIDLRPTPSPRNLDLMEHVNMRGTIGTSLAAMDLLCDTGGQIVTLSPPIANASRWLDASLPYTVSKYSMTLATLGLANYVKANCLWPKRTIATAATRMLEDMTASPVYSQGRPPRYFAEAFERLLNRDDLTGQTLVDEDLLPNPDTGAPLDLFLEG